MAPRLRSAVVRFDALPEPVLRVILLALPVDARARAACVCRSWRAFLADPTLWQVLDLTEAGGVEAARVTENLVRGAVQRAAGRLRTVNFTYLHHPLEVRQLLEIASNGAELQQANTKNALIVEDLQAVFAAPAPRLQVLNTRVFGQCTELLPILRNSPPYGPVRASHATIWFDDEVAAADVLASAAAVKAHESLKSLSLSGAGFALGLNALVDAASERRVESLTMTRRCVMDAESVPALARLVKRGSLTFLDIRCNGFPHASEACVLELCAALRACRMLKCLQLRLNPPDGAGASHRIVTELLNSAAAMPALSELSLAESNLLDPVAAGRAFGALLAANLPNLRFLSVNGCGLGDEG